MSLRNSLALRSPVEWTVRIVLALGVALFGYFGATFSLAQVAVKSDPLTAHRLAPYDGRITALYAASIAGSDATTAERWRAGTLARRALQQDPTAVVAVSILGLNAQLAGETAVARRLFSHAQHLSRRDLQTQLWRIEDAVGRSDIPDALHQYDITLRTTPGMGDTLFPVLASANSDPAIRTSLIRTLAGKPSWSAGFIIYLSTNAPDAKATVALFAGLHRAGVVVADQAQSSAVDALLSSGHLDDAWAYYATIRPDVDRRRSRDPRFAATPSSPSQFDWTRVDQEGLTTTIEKGLFDFAVSASVGGPILRQAQMLPPGDYRLVGHSRDIDQVEGALPYWTLSCVDGRELGRVVLPNSAQADGEFAGKFVVPTSCPLQILTLVARPSEAISGLTGQIDRAELVSAS